jgi:hypothetical protein
MAKKITAKMIAKFEKAIKAWKDDGDEEMAPTYVIDRCHLRSALDGLQTGNIKHAKDVISRLDTIVRDQVPTDLYDTLFDAYDK